LKYDDSIIVYGLKKNCIKFLLVIKLFFSTWLYSGIIIVSIFTILLQQIF